MYIVHLNKMSSKYFRIILNSAQTNLKSFALVTPLMIPPIDNRAIFIYAYNKNKYNYMYYNIK